MKKIFSKKLILAAIVIAIALVLWFLKSKSNIVQQCSPLPDSIYCIEFKCNSGEPEMTFGGAGSCSDGSEPVVLRTWNE